MIRKIELQKVVAVAAVVTALGLAAGASAQVGKVVLGQSNNGASAEDEIRAALAKTCQIEFVETPLQNVVAKISDTYGINVRIDTRALDAVGIGDDTPITINVRNISLKSALALMLRDLELTWIVQNEALLITTPEEAESNLVTRVYEVSDLVTDDPLQPAARSLVYSGRGDSDFDALIEAMTTIVHPESWDMVGGPGSVGPMTFGGKRVLIVSQTEEVQDKIEALFKSLRAVGPPTPVKENAAAGKPATAIEFVQVYPIAQTSRALPEDLAELVKSAVANDDWDEQQGTYVRGVAETVVVRHNRQVHRQVERLLLGIGAIVSPQVMGGTFGSGSVDGFGGGQQPLGGFFRVESGLPHGKRNIH